MEFSGSASTPLTPVGRQDDERETSGRSFSQFDAESLVKNKVYLRLPIQNASDPWEVGNGKTLQTEKTKKGKRVREFKEIPFRIKTGMSSKACTSDPKVASSNNTAPKKHQGHPGSSYPPPTIACRQSGAPKNRTLDSSMA
ncbi:hypothetical protein TNCV_2450401 [Trichonephila clavipes]|nr:hypothetical protein TNCV_2450401 [Trichonephila clavipes]